MYGRSARFYDRLYAGKDYRAASESVRAVIEKRHPSARTLLDVACGTGRHLEHLRGWYEVEGLDLNPELLSQAGERCPDVPLHEGSMIDFALPSRFDVITCLFSSIAYVRSLDNLFSTVRTINRHLNPGGLLLFEPWFTPETYWTGTITANFVDDPDVKIAWMYTSEAEGSLAILDMQFLVGTGTGIDHFGERHELGLFTNDQYLDSITLTGMAADHDPCGPFGRGLFIGSAAFAGDHDSD